MYLFSGEETCLKVMPACSVMSMKRGPRGCWPDASRFKRSCATTSASSTLMILEDKPCVTSVRVLLIARGARLLFQLPGEFELLVAVGIAPGGEIRAAELKVDVRLVGREFRCGLKALDRAFHVAQLE